MILIDAATMQFETFYREEFPSMVALARSVCGDPAAAEDLAQEAMAKAHENWPKVSAYDRPGAWLRRVTINLSISRRRRIQREFTMIRRKSLERSHENASSGSDAALWEAVRRLPPRQRAVIALFYQEDRSTKDIAEILGCTVSTATSHLNQARTRLARDLGESFDSIAPETKGAP